MHLKYGIERVLAVTTTSGMGVWEREIPKHCPFPVRVVNYQGNVVRDDPGAVLTWYIIHHGLLYGRDYSWGESAREWKSGPNEKIEAFDADLVIIDESHKIGDPQSMQSKMAYRYGKAARFRLALTGTMFHRQPAMIFGQAKFIDDSMFGTTVMAFRTQFIQFGGYGGYEIVGYRNLNQMADKLKEAVYIEEYVANTPPVVATIPVGMDDCKDVYREMETQNAVIVNDQAITAPIVLTKHLRCQQIAGGWVKDEQGEYHEVGQEKYRALVDLLGLMMDENITKVVIGCQFVPEIKDVAKAARACGYAVQAIHGGIPRGEARDKRIAAFQEDPVPTVMVCQVAAAAEAIDLSAAQDLIWYSLTPSLVIYDQFNARIEKFKETRTLRYHHLLMTGSRDEVSWLAMNLKMDVATLLIKRPDLVEKITQREDANPFRVDHARLKSM